MFRRQSERMVSIMAYIPSPPPSSPGEPIDAYGQLVSIVDLLEAVLEFVIQQGKQRSRGGPRIDWGLEALTRRTLEFWLKLRGKIPFDHNPDTTSSIISDFIQDLAIPLEITSDKRRIISEMREQRRSWKEWAIWMETGDGRKGRRPPPSDPALLLKMKG
jgi:hypothetical protein